MDAGLGLRGERHRPDLWKTLLPSTKKKLVDDGLFTPDGKITEKGRQMLASNQQLAGDKDA